MSSFLNLDLIKSPTTSSWTSNYSSSPSSSSTLSESNNSISTRKTRTPRKRPNQIYNEAASILSTAYPKLFATKHLTKPCKFTKPTSPFLFEPASLFTPSKLEKPVFSKNLNLFEKPCQVSSSGAEYEEDFDAESILEEEIEEGIDSIMGNLSMENEDMGLSDSTCYGYPIGLGLEIENGMRNESKAMKNGDEGDDWWRFPIVNVADITRKIAQIPTKKTKTKKKKKLECGKGNKEDFGSAISDETFRRTPGGLCLKLNYDDVLSAWADRGSPFSGEGPAAGDDVQVCNLISGKRKKKYKSLR
ncbi:hypothetical protein CASFOL_032298 [Castilleja foliolosa]|uniref:Uncharacterized protein n=1 Tax=Castilleja foliolosa TaxID=1961234 RepID=A0ABD3C1Q1_9LAMI